MNTPLQDGDASPVQIKVDLLKKINQEISAPITDVVTTATQLLGTLLNAAQKEAVETIQYRGQSLLTYLDDTLELAKMDGGDLRLAVADFNLRDLVEDTVGEFSAEAGAKGLELASLFYQDVPRQLRGDAEKLRQVFGYVIGNVIGYSQQGEVIVCVRRKSETGTGALLHFSIKDSGSAVRDEQQKFFRAFEEGHTGVRGFDSSGLRVSIIRKLVEIMGGEAGVESVQGREPDLWFTAYFEKQEQMGGVPPASFPPAARIPSIPKSAIPAFIPTPEPVVEPSKSVAKEETNGVFAAPQPVEAPTMEAGTPVSEPPLEIPKFEEPSIPTVPKVPQSEPEVETVPVVPRFQKDQPAEAAAVPFYQNRPVSDEAGDTLTGNSDLSPVPSIPKPPLLKLIMSKFPKQENGHGENSGKRRILVAEDNATNQKVILMKLQKMGYEAEVVSNGAEALDAVERASYDLILMDCTMPEMDGYEAATRIRVREGGNGKRIPIIAMAANIVENDREKCAASGMDDTISKTAGPEDLQRIIGNWLPA